MCLRSAKQWKLHWGGTCLSLIVSSYQESSFIYRRIHLFGPFLQQHMISRLNLSGLLFWIILGLLFLASLIDAKQAMTTPGRSANDRSAMLTVLLTLYEHCYSHFIETQAPTHFPGAACVRHSLCTSKIEEQ